MWGEISKLEKSPDNLVRMKYGAISLLIEFRGYQDLPMIDILTESRP